MECIIKGNGKMICLVVMASLYFLMVISMMAIGSMGYHKVLAFMSLGIQFGDIKGSGKMVYNVGRAKKLLMMGHFIKDNFKMG